MCYRIPWARCEGFDFIGPIKRLTERITIQITHGWLITSPVTRGIVRRSCFVDPVCFCLWEAQICYKYAYAFAHAASVEQANLVLSSFLYSKPRTGIEILMRYFVGEELGIANTLQRHFDCASLSCAFSSPISLADMTLAWPGSINLLFPPSIPSYKDPSQAAYFIAGQDAILDAERVRRYLVEQGIPEADGEANGGVFVDWGLAHGQGSSLSLCAVA